MTNLREYFHTDWAAMTTTDWVGLTLTVTIFLLLVGIFFHVLRPKNRERFESHRHIPIDDDDPIDLPRGKQQ